MARAALKVVPDPAPRKRERVSVVAALDGTSRDVMVAMRLNLAQKIDADEVSPNSIASSYRELRELDRLIRVAELEQEEFAERVDGVDEGFDASSI